MKFANFLNLFKKHSYEICQNFTSVFGYRKAKLRYI